jgi:uncharacterized protein
MEYVALRLKPGSDVKRELESITRETGLKAGWVVTCAGSLRTAVIRLAGRDYTRTLEGHYEIISLTGTLSPDGAHLHIALADSRGETFGGHLEDGSIVYTTAELVIGQAQHFAFSRCYDPETGYPELIISQTGTESSETGNQPQ